MATALNSFISHLAEGNRVTSRQARTLFNVENVADLVYRARNEGISVYTNVTKKNGVKTFSYRLGLPTRVFQNYVSQGHLGRARKTLYRDAIRVTLANR